MINKFITMLPMMYYDRAPEKLSANLKQKRNDMLDNKDGAFVATVKFDGEWAMIIRGEGDFVHIRSRNISKVTGTYGDMTEKLPHIVAAALKLPPNTVLLAEICWRDKKNVVSTDVGTIMRCKPDKAVQRQQEGEWLDAALFDVLMLDGEETMEWAYENRLALLSELWDDDHISPPFYPPLVVTDDYRAAADKIIEDGGEGIVIQRRDYIYEPGKRAAWKTLKVKEKLPTTELQVIAAVPANKAYAGKNLEYWDFWEWEGKLYNSKRPHPSATPISEPYYYGWSMGVKCRYKDGEVVASSGLTNLDREWLSTAEAQRIIAEEMLYAEISGMAETADGKIRQPVVKRLRIMDDKMKENIE